MEDESSSDDGLEDEPYPTRFKKLRYIDEVENILGRAFTAQGEDEPPELPELVDFNIPGNGFINTTDDPLTQHSMEVGQDVDNSIVVHHDDSSDLTPELTEAIRVSVEELLQTDAFSFLQQVQHYHHIVEFRGGSVIAGEIPSSMIYRI